MVLVYLNILTQSIAITDSMFNFGKCLTKDAITFDLTEIERKKISRRHEILLLIQCCHKKCQNRKKKNPLFPKIFSTKFTCLGLIKRIYESTISNIVLNLQKIMKSMSTLYFETLLTAKS